MDLRRFITDNQPEWELLQSYLDRIRNVGLTALTPEELRELGVLHRKISADLAAARSSFAGSKVVALLNDLALRSHNAVYRAPRRGPLGALRALARGIPEAVCRHTGALFASTVVFFTGSLLAAFGTMADESVASMVMGRKFVEEVQNGNYWIEQVFSVFPQSVASARILTNNLTVAVVVFTVGCTGIFPAFILFFNGMMLGTVFTLCTQYDLLPRFLPFVITHGVIEISAILVAGAGGFVFFDSWLHPGDRTRMEGLRHGAKEGLLVAAAAAPALLIAGPVEGLISPVEQIPGGLRIALGVALGLGFWAWILGPLRSRGGSPGRGIAFRAGPDA